MTPTELLPVAARWAALAGLPGMGLAHLGAEARAPHSRGAPATDLAVAARWAARPAGVAERAS